MYDEDEKIGVVFLLNLKNNVDNKKEITFFLI